MNLNIYQRINEVMKDVKYVKKDQQVIGGGANYKAVTHDQVLKVVRESMVNHGIVVEPHQVGGQWYTMRDMNAQPQPVKMGLYGGEYAVNFVNIDNPEDRATIRVHAHACDNGDKAPGKAITYATKSALLKMFSLETGVNDEERPYQPILNDDIEEKYKYLVDTKNHIGLYEFMEQFSPDDPIRKALITSWEHGSKTEMKNIHLDLIKETDREINSWAQELINNHSDETVCIEFWDELSELFKRKVWGRLDNDTKQYIKDRKANQ